ncbi:MAG TPA: ECF-type sigma factor [Steroidobacteraceae bacterium]|jgi:RNA polymerase sigma factor (TIGR02999 family)|nr:ECF-type sigma factor [Steroidobacteraceae bacterium]
MTMEVPANFTQLLTEWRSGEPRALERLTPLVYDELRRLARSYMRAERGSHTLQATAVVHEAFLRLVQANVDLQDRQHFFALASRLMRRVLVDHAKSRTRVKRDAGVREAGMRDAGGRDQTGVDMTQISLPIDVDVVALDEALESLLQLEPRLAQVIELHYFGGMTYDEIAAAVDASAATVHRDIRLAKAWLLNEIKGSYGR